jgi:hypothetical protein
MAEDEWNIEEINSWEAVTVLLGGEIWCPFDFAAEIIERRIGSRGVAERTLRELCAKGDIRSIRCKDPLEQAKAPELIKPSEWVGKQPDLETKWPQYVMVSNIDVAYWIGDKPLVRWFGDWSAPLTVDRLQVRN